MSRFLTSIAILAELPIPDMGGAALGADSVPLYAATPLQGARPPGDSGPIRAPLLQNLGSLSGTDSLAGSGPLQMMGPLLGLTPLFDVAEHAGVGVALARNGAVPIFTSSNLGGTSSSGNSNGANLGSTRVTTVTAPDAQPFIPPATPPAPAPANNYPPTQTMSGN